MLVSEIWCNTTDAGKRTFDTSWAASYLIHQSIDNLKSEHIWSRTSLQAVLFFISWSFGVNLQISPNHHFMLCYVMLCYVIQAGIVLFGFFHLAICPVGFTLSDSNRLVFDGSFAASGWLLTLLYFVVWLEGGLCGEAPGDPPCICELVLLFYIELSHGGPYHQMR